MGSKFAVEVLALLSGEFVACSHKRNATRTVTECQQV
jgi:hypothetical protein